MEKQILQNTFSLKLPKFCRSFSEVAEVLPKFGYVRKKGAYYEL